MRGIQFDHEHPILETIFPLTGDRIEGLISPVVTSPVFAVRTRPKRVFSLQEMDEAGLTTEALDPLNAKRHRDTFLERVIRVKYFSIRGQLFFPMESSERG